LPSLAQLDHQFIWHPFTQMRDWRKREPIVIVSGRGAVLRDARGREYLDANSSIWTNLHGHRHPAIDAVGITADTTTAIILSRRACRLSAFVRRT
jgi:adenosylmethionine-8-amino-7-oxononanoate aminotransferase